MTVGIAAWATHLPLYRLERATIAAAIGGRGGRGSRAVAGYDQDTTSMGVEAARGLDPAAPSPELLVFATTDPGYADRTNAAAVHAALGLDPAVPAYDSVGSVRSALGAFRAAADSAAAGRPALAVLSDVRWGLAGSGDERDGGDAAAAFVLADSGPLAAELLAHRSTTGEFLDRWRKPGESFSRVWEERFGETAYVPLAEAALADGLKEAGLTPTDVDHLIVTGLHARAGRTVLKRAGARPDALVDDLVGSIGNCGAAHPGVLLASVLEQAAPGAVVVLLTLADGADCIVLRVADGVAERRPAVSVAAQLPGRSISYQDALTWRGMLRREPPRRPDPDRPAAPPALRRVGWKFGFVGSACVACGTRHLPPERVCFNCKATDQMTPVSLAGESGTVATFSIDHLAYSVAPPVVLVVVDLDGGGRLQCELTDVDADTVAVGNRVELTFRRLYTTVDGVHDYFWKARPVRAMEG
ncbi:MAG TPA: OB-fold domain-containing protein [Acidimicrobiales bacterium]|nr:OB-fold domain-containing protein [Acidimicrobiales bacterium]